MNEYVELAGRMMPVVGSVQSERFGSVPLLEIPLMSDERWQAMCRESFLGKFEREHGAQTVFPEREYKEYCAEIRRNCEDMPDEEIPVVRYA